jgi:type I restriction enzyme S subunit
MGKLCSISSGESDTQDAVEDGPYAFFDRSKTIKRSSRFLYDCEALIIPGEGKEFLPKHFEGKFDLHQRAYALFDFLPELDVRFLYHLLHHRSDYFPSVAVGATVKSLRRRHFEDLPVPVPPLPDQQRIVGLLDEAFEGLATAKANAEKNLQNARALFESHLQSVFTQRGPEWEEKTLGDLFDITSSKRVFEADWKTEGVPFYRAREIVKLAKQGYVDNELFISAEMFNTYSAKYGIPAPGDIMVTGVGTLGICYVVKQGDRFYFKDGNIIWLRKKTKVDSRFVEHAFRSEFLRKQIDDSVGATVGTFTIIKAKGTRIPLPSVSEQPRVVQQLDSLREDTQRLARIYERKLAALEALKKSLLHQAFTGQL